MEKKINENEFNSYIYEQCTYIFYAFTTLTIKYVRWKRLSSVYIPFFFLQLVKLSQVTRIWRHHYINFFFSEHCWQTDSH